MKCTEDPEEKRTLLAAKKKKNAYKKALFSLELFPANLKTTSFFHQLQNQIEETKLMDEFKARFLWVCDGRLVSRISIAPSSDLISWI